MSGSGYGYMGRIPTRRMLDAVVFLSCFAVNLHFMAPGIAMEDSGEFVTAAVTLSLTHEPGYPLYILVGKLFSFLPVGSPAFRLNLVSAICAAASALLLCVIIRQLAPGKPLIGILTAFSFALTPGLIFQATLAEKYALNVALIAGLIVLMLRVWRYGIGSMPLLALLGGLSLSHHMQTLYLVPALAGLGWRCQLIRRPRILVVFILCGMLGLSLKIVALPLLSCATPSLMAGQLNNAKKLTHYLLARGYSKRFEAYSTGQKLVRIWTRGLVLTADQVGFPLLALASLGGWYAWKYARPFLFHGLAGSVLALGLIANLQIMGEEHYLLPVFLWLYALAGIGLVYLSGLRARIATGLALLILIVATLMRGIPWIDLTRSYAALDWGRNYLKSLGVNAVLVTQRDDDLNSIEYLQRVVDERPDVILVHRSFMTSLALHEGVKRLHPGISVLDKKLIPWGMTVGPDSPLTFFLNSHYGKREIAFTYPANAETAEGFLLTPDGCVFRVSRREVVAALPRASAFAERLRRFRLRSSYETCPAGPLLRELAMAPSVLWAQLALRWRDRKNPAESLACFQHALRYPSTCVIQENAGQWEVRLRYY